MTDLFLWNQGVPEIIIPRCSGDRPATCPSSLRVASEYNTGFFTLSNTICPHINWDKSDPTLVRPLRDIKVDDYIWLVLVPPEHTIIDAFIKSELLTASGSSYESLAGVELVLSMAVFDKADETTGICPDKNSEAPLVTLTFSNDERSFARSDMNYTFTNNKWIGLGVKVNALPRDGYLADITASIVVGAHILGYDTPVYL